MREGRRVAEALDAWLQGKNLVIGEISPP